MIDRERLRRALIVAGADWYAGSQIKVDAIADAYDDMVMESDIVKRWNDDYRQSLAMIALCAVVIAFIVLCAMLHG